MASAISAFLVLDLEVLFMRSRRTIVGARARNRYILLTLLFESCEIKMHRKASVWGAVLLFLCSSEEKFETPKRFAGAD